MKIDLRIADRLVTGFAAFSKNVDKSTWSLSGRLFPLRPTSPIATGKPLHTSDTHGRSKFEKA